MVCAQAPPAPAEPAEPAEPAGISDEVKREIETQTIERLLQLLYFTWVCLILAHLLKQSS